MRNVFSATLAIAVLSCAASPLVAKAPLAVYYSFDAPAPTAVFQQMQSELGRILAPSGMSAAWLPVDVPRTSGQDFPAVVVVRFAGHCSFEGPSNGAADPAGQALAEADTVAGHVLPFARVDCDRVRALITPSLLAMPPAWKSEMLGRALARVSAHEIYHMLSGVETHGASGIFQAGHSRRDLTATTFSFAAPENSWLHGWLQRQTDPVQVAKAVPGETTSGSGAAVLDESDSADFAGR